MKTLFAKRVLEHHQIRLTNPQAVVGWCTIMHYCIHFYFWIMQTKNATLFLAFFAPGGDCFRYLSTV
jgi:hypothetical protein